MNWEVIVVYVILVTAVVLFITDRVRTDIVGMLIISVLGLLGILEPKELLQGFSNQALVTIAAMFVLSAALMRSGLVAALSGKLTDLSKGSPVRFLALSLCAVCFMSAFINNTPVVVVFIPAVLTVCSRLGQSPSKFLMPISFHFHICSQGTQCQRDAVLLPAETPTISQLPLATSHPPLQSYQILARLVNT